MIKSNLAGTDWLFIDNTRNPTKSYYLITLAEYQWSRKSNRCILTYFNADGFQINGTW